MLNAAVLELFHCGRGGGGGGMHNTVATFCSVEIQIGPQGTVPSSVGLSRQPPHVHS